MTGTSEILASYAHRAEVPLTSGMTSWTRPERSERCDLGYGSSTGQKGTAVTAAASQRDFFISYTSADRAWAEWVAWQLEDDGYSTVLRAWDFRPGDNFVVRMRDALEQADRTIALLSAAYLASPYATDEWTGAFLHDKDHKGRLLPVRIEACELPRLLATRVYIDLVGLGRQQARTQLLEGVEQGRRRPKREPGFGGSGEQMVRG
jgi:hypothetical protein